MTRADTWKKRPVVTNYWAYKDELNAAVKEFDIKVEDELFVEFYMPMPKSWSNKKKSELLSKPHQQKPDIDNLVKGVMDALFKEDSHVHTIYAKKTWAKEASITFVSGKNLVGYLS
tara:strand:+ start:7877 stop:8224 length:348 start_codon:yes stop_codon:yes gene_type:complete